MIKATAKGTATLVIVGLVLAFSLNFRDKTKRGQDGVNLSVQFEPSSVPNPVLITVTLDGVPVIPSTPVRQSPWNRNIWAARDAVIILEAKMGNGSWVDCYISRADATPVTFRANAPGTARCTSRGA